MNDFLHEYIDAEHVGQSGNSTCAAEYRECPISLYNLFRTRVDGSGNVLTYEDDEDDDESEDDDDYENNELSHNNNSHNDHRLEIVDHVTSDPNLLEKEHLLVGGINSV